MFAKKGRCDRARYIGIYSIDIYVFSLIKYIYSSRTYIYIYILMGHASLSLRGLLKTLVWVSRLDRWTAWVFEDVDIVRRCRYLQAVTIEV